MLAQSDESQSPESPTPFSRNVGESRSRIPNLKAKLQKASGSSRNISSLAQSAESQSPESPTPFS